MNPGKRITQYEVAELFGSAYSKIAPVDKCVSGFKAGGIWPFKSAIFNEGDFAASDHLLGDRQETTVNEATPTPPLASTFDAGHETMADDESSSVRLLPSVSAAEDETVVETVPPLPSIAGVDETLLKRMILQFLLLSPSLL